MNVRYHRDIGIFMGENITLSTSDPSMGIFFALRVARPGTMSLYYWLGPRYARREHDRALRSKQK
jgi:hypothetical protein